MANSYEKALAALAAMQRSENDLRTEMANLAGPIQSRIIANPMTGVTVSDADYIQWMNMNALAKKHTEWGRKIHGVMMGYAREMTSGMKGAMKGRIIGFDDADVTIGSGSEAFAKAVQHKHTVSADVSAVDTMIGKAANQLTGESGETPKPGQRGVIDVMINESNNWWPFVLGDLTTLDNTADLNSGIIPKDFLLAKAARRIYTKLSTYSYAKTGLNPATVGSLASVPATAPSFARSTHGPKTTQPVVPSSTGGPAARPNVVTIKIVYGQPRIVTDRTTNTLVAVGSMVFEAYVKGGALTVEFVKIKAAA